MKKCLYANEFRWKGGKLIAMENKRKKEEKIFGWRDKLGYLFGDFGNDFTFILSSSFLLKFYTDVMGVSAALVGVVMMVARFVDAFTDVAMGRICDRTKPTSAGKFKPWILRMCGPVAIASFLIYQSGFADMPMWFKISWLFDWLIFIYKEFILCQEGTIRILFRISKEHLKSAERVQGKLVLQVVMQDERKEQYEMLCRND